MPKDYLPASDGRLLSWSANLSHLVGLSPGEYGISSVVAAELAAKQASFAEARARAFDPETRGLSTVFRKNTLRKELVAMMREVVRAIQGVIGLSDQKKLHLGITVRKTGRSVTSVPDAPPSVQLLRVDGRRVNVRIDDAATTRRARPASARGAAIFSYAGSSPPAALRDWTFEHNTIDRNATVTFPTHLPPGTKVWITVRWLSANLQPGPSCTPLETNLGCGHVLPASRLAA